MSQPVTAPVEEKKDEAQVKAANLLTNNLDSLYQQASPNPSANPFGFFGAPQPQMPGMMPNMMTNPMQANPMQANPMQVNPMQTNPMQANPVQGNPVQANLLGTNSMPTAPVQTTPPVSAPAPSNPLLGQSPP